MFPWKRKKGNSFCVSWESIRFPSLVLVWECIWVGRDTGMFLPSFIAPWLTREGASRCQLFCGHCSTAVLELLFRVSFLSGSTEKMGSDHLGLSPFPTKVMVSEAHPLVPHSLGKPSMNECVEGAFPISATTLDSTSVARCISFNCTWCQWQTTFGYTLKTGMLYPSYDEHTEK